MFAGYPEMVWCGFLRNDENKRGEQFLHEIFLDVGKYPENEASENKLQTKREPHICLLAAE